MPLAKRILQHPVTRALLRRLLAAGIRAVRHVGPRTARAVEPLRRAVWRALDPIARRRGRPLTRDKTDSGEFICTVDVGLLELARALWAQGWRWNPFSTAKYRVAGQRKWAVLPVVYREGVDADVQYDYYIFASADGLAIWGHQEANITDPREHAGGDEQVADGAGMVLRGALAAAGIDNQATGSNNY